MAYKRKKRGGEAERITIIVVIIIAMLIVIATIAINLFNTPERNVKSKIDDMISDYYENFFYKDVLNNISNESTRSKTLEKYHDAGFSRVYFRQLFLYDNEKYANEAPLIQKYCDENASFVIYYPDPPYGQTNYHTKIYYSCEF